ncbi:MAG TPA: CRISPR-associated protein Csx15 [Blastocatellia bacterium]|nr:CRISPR-associated protein Csx15 [Blastocatellia bacterium]
MIIVNFTHPLTPAHLVEVATLTGQPVVRVMDVKTQFDHTQPFILQIRALVESAGLSTQEWQTAPLLINLPSLNVITALLLAELHGRCGYFPAVLRLRPVPNTTPPQFEVAEVLNLQAVRDEARQRR